MCTCGVIQLVYKSIPLSNDDIVYLKDLYNRLPGRNFARYYNLFSVTRKDVSPNLNEDGWKSVQQKLLNQAQGQCITNYFLFYGEGSFTMMHRDSPLRVENTAITMIDKSSDLIGGDIIVSRRVKNVNGDIHIPSDEEIKFKKEPVPVMSNITAMTAIPQSVGETVWYPAKMSHGVTQVTQGYRLVLISWYKNENDQIQKEQL